jgi:hypothetical protein
MNSSTMEHIQHKAVELTKNEELLATALSGGDQQLYDLAKKQLIEEKLKQKVTELAAVQPAEAPPTDNTWYGKNRAEQQSRVASIQAKLDAANG